MVDVMASDKKQTRYAAEKEAKATQGMTAAAENHETWLGARKLKAVLINSITAVGSLFQIWDCLLYTSPSPRDRQKSRMPSSA